MDPLRSLGAIVPMSAQTKRIILLVNLNITTTAYSAVEIDFLPSLLSYSPNVTSPEQFFAYTGCTILLFKAGSSIAKYILYLVGRESSVLQDLLPQTPPGISPVADTVLQRYRNAHYTYKYYI